MEQFCPFTLNISGRILEYLRPAVMGIVNVTPDSFYAPSRSQSRDALAALVEKMVAEGADMIDVGACSTRPGSTPVDADEELRRLQWALPVVREVAPEIPVSVDTFRARIAAEAVKALGANMVNDVTGGADEAMFETVASLQVPYILTHNAPAEGVGDDEYSAHVVTELSMAYNRLRRLGVNDIIIDPGLGFAKNPDQCYALLRDLPALPAMFHCPVLVGASRKSLITAKLGITADEALAATTAVNTAAMMQGAAIVRVHDVLPARQAADIVTALRYR